MFRTGLAMILSGALAVSSVTATPARAGNDAAIAAGILGALALFAIAKNQKNEHKPATVGRSYHGRDAVRDQRRSRQRHLRTLPAACSFEVEGRGGERRFVSGRCLSRHGYRAELPKRCEYRIKTRRGTRTAYPLRCLDRYGYRLSRARY